MTGRATGHTISLSGSLVEETKAKEVRDMKVSIIPWHVFLQACEEPKRVMLDGWLRRWVFADDGVRPSVEPAR